jgi:hypothetical protein
MILLSANALCMKVAVTASASASVPLPATGVNVRLVNEGPNTCYISVGVGAQTATLPGTTPARTCTPVLVGEDISLGLQDTVQVNQISAICASGTTTIDVQVGGGI